MSSPFAIRLATHYIQRGGIIIYPTETVYGLGCDPINHHAVKTLKHLKQRNENANFLLLASDISQLTDYIETPSQDELNKINATDTPTSWITQAKHHAPTWLVSENNTIGFRITKHATTKQLCNRLGHPIISTSANIKGGTPASNTLKFHQLFADTIDYILISNIARSEKPSVIRHLATGQKLR